MSEDSNALRRFGHMVGTGFGAWVGLVSGSVKAGIGLIGDDDLEDAKEKIRESVVKCGDEGGKIGSDLAPAAVALACFIAYSRSRQAK